MILINPGGREVSIQDRFVGLRLREGWTKCEPSRKDMLKEIEKEVGGEEQKDGNIRLIPTEESKKQILEDLRDAYKEKFGKLPHPAAKVETLIEKLKA